MTKKFKQFRFFVASGDKNYPSTMTATDLISGQAFESILPIKHLGIQTLPGVKFGINGESVMVGNKGIFELENTNIVSLAFDAVSIATIANNESGYLLIDIEYEEPEV